MHLVDHHDVTREPEHPHELVAHDERRLQRLIDGAHPDLREKIRFLFKSQRAHVTDASGIVEVPSAKRALNECLETRVA